MEELRNWLTSWAMPAVSQLGGVIFKAWFHNEVMQQWGGVYLVEDMSVFSRLPTQDGNTGPLRSAPDGIIWGALQGAVTGTAGTVGLMNVVNGDAGARVFMPSQLEGFDSAAS
ncbi:hypothetical protein MHK71_01605 [Kocuria indica]|uniref:hypothetical protein n=1 Tax=Kocuria marina TaxID=223184 RepID=UPI001EF42362|nr:hypothetical protein [Kocuria indica]MCG7431219.1 hypothetical protein [Kocuria indica]